MSITVEYSEKHLHLKELSMSDQMTEEYTAEIPMPGEALHNSTNGSERFTVTLPSQDDIVGVENFLASLQTARDKYGVKSLAKWTDKYLDHVKLSETMWDRVVKSTHTVNGVRTSTQLKGDKKKGLHRTATTFYSSLSTPLLRAQCAVFNLDYNSYESVEDVVAALVEKSVEVTVV